MWDNKKCYYSSFIANSTTTLFGFGIGQLILKDTNSLFGHLVNWGPIDYYLGELRLDRTVYIFIFSFILTLVFETIIYILTLKKTVTQENNYNEKHFSEYYNLFIGCKNISYIQLLSY